MEGGGIAPVWGAGGPRFEPTLHFLNMRDVRWVNVSAKVTIHMQQVYISSERTVGL